MSEDWKLRLGIAEDVARVLDLERGMAEAPHWSEREYRAIVAADACGPVRRRMFVAESAGDLLGFAVGSVTGAPEPREAAAGERWGELESVAVAESARRRGVGRALCKEVVAWCEAEGAERVELEVRERAVAVKLYGSMGFAVAGRRPGYYAQPREDALLMMRMAGRGLVKEEHG